MYLTENNLAFKLCSLLDFVSVLLVTKRDEICYRIVVPSLCGSSLGKERKIDSAPKAPKVLTGSGNRKFLNYTSEEKSLKGEEIF